MHEKEERKCGKNCEECGKKTIRIDKVKPKKFTEKGEKNMETRFKVGLVGVFLKVRVFKEVSSFFKIDGTGDMLPFIKMEGILIRIMGGVGKKESEGKCGKKENTLESLMLHGEGREFAYYNLLGG